MMRKTWKRALASMLALAMTVSNLSGFSAEVKAAEAGEVTVVEKDGGITIGNGYISREFSTANSKLSTANITNKRTDGGNTVFTPGEGSEEFIVRVTKQESQSAPVELEALDRTGWTAEADSRQNASGANDGPAQNLLDGDLNSIWHTNYGGGIGGTSFPYNVVINLNGSKTFKSFSYTPRQNGENTNGNLLGYELYASNSETALAANAEGWTKVAEGQFKYNGVNPIYVNLAEECTATQVKLVGLSAKNGDTFGGGAEFNLHKDLAPVEAEEKREFKTSDLKLSGVTSEETTATINNVAKTGQKVTFTFEPYAFTYKDTTVTYTVTENVVMYDGDHFMRKYMEISVSDPEKAVIDYIDLESFAVNESDAQWTIPTDAGGIVQMDQYKANLGQPIYIQGMFFGSEFPETDTEIVDGTGFIRYYSGKSFDRLKEDHQLTTDGKYVTWQTVAGAARSTENQVIQADFFEYIYSIATPSDFRIQYNSWFDNMMSISDESILTSFIEIDRELNKAETRPLDSYVVDDGWNNYNDGSFTDVSASGEGLNQTGFWEFNSKFPEGLTPSSELVHKFGSNFGVWVGPRGGYNYQTKLAGLLATSGKGSSDGWSIDVADRVYVENFKEMACKWQDDYGVNYWKWDGFADQYQYSHFAAADGVPGYANRHMTGGYNNMYHVTDLWEAWIDLFEAARQNAKENGISNLWISLTCYTNPSPWFLQWANSVWIQCHADQADAGASQSKMDRQMTYRDAVYYDFLKNHEFQFPLGNIYNHDPIYGVTGTGMDMNSATDEQFQNYLYMQATRGTAFWELHFSDSIMTEGKYEATSEFLAWAEENHHILKNAKMFGATPNTGTVLAANTSEGSTQNAYGYACFDGNDGIISVRNAATEAKEVSFTFDRNIGVPENAGTLKYHLEHTHNLTEGTASTGTFTYGETYTVTLQPDEVRIFRISKDGDTKAPQMVRAYVNENNEIIVKFDEKVTGSKLVVENAQVENAVLGADDTTYHIGLAETPADGTVIKVKTEDVKDMAGNACTNELSFVYHKDHVVAAGSAAKEASLSGNNGFSVLAVVKEAKEGTLIQQKDAYSLGINKDGYATFTLNGATAVSDVKVEADNVIVAVKENNGMLKLYVEGQLVGSAYKEENRYYEVKQAEITVQNASLSKVLDVAYGYDVVEDLIITKTMLKGQLTAAEAYHEEDYTAKEWSYIKEAMADVKALLEKEAPTEAELREAYQSFNETMAAFALIDTSEAKDQRKDIFLRGVTATAGSEDSTGYAGQSYGKVEYALDGDLTTAWMTDWNGFVSTINDGKGWIDIKFPEAHTVDGLRYLPGGSISGSLTTITGFEVYVKTADSDEYVKVVSNGTWENSEGWKTVEFEAVENVTNVKLLATAAAPTNWWAVAAEIRVMSAAECAAAIPEEKPSTPDTKPEDKPSVPDTKPEDKPSVPDTKPEDKPSTPVEKDPVTDVFTDISSEKWYVNAVQYVYNTGLMSGFQDKFTPDANMSRAMVVTTLYRMEGSPAVTDYSAYLAFKDVKEGDWYADAVAWALNNDIATGDPINQKFNPNANVTREQLAAFLYRYTEFKGGSVTERGDLSGMKNANKVSSWALKEMQWAVGTELISGIAEVKGEQIVARDLAPQGNATRAQMATILQRYCTQ